MDVETLVPGLVGMSLGFGGAVVLGREVLEGLGSGSWSEAPGRITTSRVELVRDESATDPTAVARLGYQYVVQGKTYTGTRLSFGAWIDGNRAVAAAIAERYPPGATVSVFYDPARPQRSVLERRVSVRLRLFAIGCAVLGLTVAAALISS